MIQIENRVDSLLNYLPVPISKSNKGRLTCLMIYILITNRSVIGRLFSLVLVIIIYLD